VLQHELDHLDGVLMLDRTTTEQRRAAVRALNAGVPWRPATSEASPRPE
jgi:peptide deformylase